jgi:nucleoside-diphosphate-sugar epimerase
MEASIKDSSVKRILIVGGTRNVGYFTTLRLMAAGHQVTVLNRGMSPDDLPPELPRLRADRTNPQQMKRALLAKTFDVVVDFVMYREAEAAMMLELLRDQVGHYIVISSGQVYSSASGARAPL